MASGVAPGSGLSLRSRAEHVAVAGALAEQADEIAGDAHEDGLRFEAGAQADAGEVVEDDEIDVGGVVELEGAVLAHAEHDVAGGLVGEPIAGLGGLAEEEAHRRRDSRVGGFRQAAGDGHHRPDAGQIAECGEKRDVGLEQAQRAHGFWEGARGCDGRTEVARERGEALFRGGGERAEQACRMALDQAGQIGRGAEDAREQVAHGRLGDQGPERGKLRLVAAAASEIGKDAGRAPAIVDERRGSDAGMEDAVGHMLVLLVELFTKSPVLKASA